jgi:hypothetical protein
MIRRALLSVSAVTTRRYLAVGRKPIIRRPGSRSREVITTTDIPPPSETSASTPLDPWTEVKDPASGKIYYWNKSTNETTALGAPKPTSISAAPQDSMASSLGIRSHDHVHD